MKSVYGGQTLTDLGHSVGVKFWQHWKADGKGEIGGLIEEHDDKRDPSKRCAGSISFEGHTDPGRPGWHVVSLEPLTLTPSLLCTECGNHGFITDGKWVPA